MQGWVLIDWLKSNWWRLAAVLGGILTLCALLLGCMYFLLGPWYRNRVEALAPRLWPTATPVPTLTPDWDMRQDASDFVREFCRAERHAFNSGDLDSLQRYFCPDGPLGMPWLETFEPFSEYKKHANDWLAAGLCPFSLDDVKFPDDTPWGEPAKVQIMTQEHWADGPCPTDGTSGLEGCERRVVVERRDSAWCISESTMERLVPE